MKILIVDDIEENLYMLQVILENEGYDVEAAINGKDALDRAQHDPPGLVISDILMPVMDGFTLCSEWQKDVRLRSIPFIFYSATYTSTKDEELALKLGADRFLRKPLEPEQVIQVVKELEGSKNERKEKVPYSSGDSEDQEEVLKLYNERLVNKLESKMFQLEEILAKNEKAQEALRTSEERYRNLVEGALDAIVSSDLSGKITSWNKAAEEIFGYTKDEAVGNNISMLTNETLAESQREEMKKLRTEGRIEFFETVRISKSGSEIPVEIMGSVLRDEHGVVIGGSAIIRDITKRRKIELAMRESEERFRAIFDQASEFMTILSPDGTILAVNRKISEMDGYTPDFIGRSFWDDGFWPTDPSHPVMVREHFLKARSGETVSFEIKEVDESGNPHFVENIIYPINKADDQVEFLIASGNDITVRKLTEESLKESEEKVRNILDSSPNAITVTDLKGKIIDCNEETLRVHGYSSTDEIIGLNAFDLISEKDHERAMKNRKLALREGSVKNVEYELIRKNGETFPGELSGSLIRDSEGQPMAFIAITRDITQRKKAEEKLEINKIILENSSDLAYTCDVKGNITYLNKIFEELSGHKTEEFIGAPFSPLFDKENLEIAIDNFSRTLHGESPVYELLFKDTGKLCEYQNHPLKDENGSITGVIGVARDITDRKLADIALRSEKEFTDTALDAQKDTFFLFELSTGKAIRWNKAFSEVSGYLDEEIASLPAPASYYGPEDLKRAAEFIEEIMKEGTGTIELDLISKDGHTVPTEYQVSIIHDEAGNPIHMISIGRDITERKKADEKLRESEKRYRSLFDNAGEGILIAQDGVMKLFNPKIMDISGYSKDELQDKPFLDLVYPDDREMVLSRHKRRLAGEDIIQKYSFRIVDKNGNIKWVEINVTLIEWGKKPAILTFLIDITERKHAESLFKENSERLRLALHSASMGSWEWNIQENLVEWSLETLNIFGIKADEFGGTYEAYLDYVTPESRKQVNDGVQIFLRDASNLSTIQYEHEIKRGNGETGWVEVRGTLFTNEHDEPFRMTGICAEITERKLADSRLKAQEETIRSIVETSQDWIWNIDLEGNHTYSNPAVKDILGYDLEEIVRKSSLELMHIEDREAILTILPQLIKEKTGWKNRVIRWKHKDGSYRWLESSAVPILDDNGELFGFRGVDRDISERMRSQEEMEKLASLVKHSSELINLSTLDGRMIFLNEAGGGMLGIEAEDVANMQIMDVIPEHLRGLVESELLPALIRGETWKGDLQYRNLKTDGLIDVHATCFTVKNPSTQEPLYLANVSLDITKRKQAEEQMRQMDYLIESASSAIATSDLEGRMTYANPTFLEMWGFDNFDEFLGRSFTEFWIVADKLDDIMETLRNEGNWTGENQARRKDGTIFDVQISAAMVHDSKGKPISLMSSSVDITERKRAEKALQESEEKFLKIFQTSPNVLMISSLEDGRILEVNDYGVEAIGISKEELLKKTSIELGLIDLETRGQLINKLQTEGHFSTVEIPVTLPSGAKRVGLFYGQIITLGGTKRLFQTIVDITERKEAEKGLKESLLEKETLLRELYHRTKNNMQVIVGMLELQSVYSKDEKQIKIFRDIENRIQTMALVHKKLYQSKNLASIDLHDYVKELSEVLVQSYSVNPDNTTLELNIDAVPISIDIAIPCGLVLNELFTNTLKYAWPDGGKGVISIHIGRDDSGNIDLTFSDDGVGVPEGMTLRDLDSLGMKIIYSIVEHQLQGTIEFNHKKGLGCKISFNENLYKRRM